jgi:hypothetical protein
MVQASLSAPSGRLVVRLMVDRMASLWALVYEWEGEEYWDPRPKDEISRAKNQMAWWRYALAGGDGGIP